jgi:hypothetical protein
MSSLGLDGVCVLLLQHTRGHGKTSVEPRVPEVLYDERYAYLANVPGSHVAEKCNIGPRRPLQRLVPWKCDTSTSDPLLKPRPEHMLPRLTPR